MSRSLVFLIMVLGGVWVLLNEYSAKKANDPSKQYISNFVGVLTK
jgi:hypothetical protein